MPVFSTLFLGGVDSGKACLGKALEWGGQFRSVHVSRRAAVNLAHAQVRTRRLADTAVVVVSLPAYEFEAGLQVSLIHCRLAMAMGHARLVIALTKSDLLGDDLQERCARVERTLRRRLAHVGLETLVVVSVSAAPSIGDGGHNVVERNNARLTALANEEEGFCLQEALLAVVAVEERTAPLRLQVSRVSPPDRVSAVVVQGVLHPGTLEVLVATTDAEQRIVTGELMDDSNADEREGADADPSRILQLKHEEDYSLVQLGAPVAPMSHGFSVSCECEAQLTLFEGAAIPLRQGSRITVTSLLGHDVTADILEVRRMQPLAPRQDDQRRVSRTTITANDTARVRLAFTQATLLSAHCVCPAFSGMCMSQPNAGIVVVLSVAAVRRGQFTKSQHKNRDGQEP